MNTKRFIVVACMSIVAVGCEEKASDAPPTTAKPAMSNAAPTATSATATTTAAATPTVPSASAAPSTSASTLLAGPDIELVPKASFGPIKLGATKKEIEALGVLKVHPQYSGMTIPYTVYYDAAGNAKRIQLSLKYAPGDVKIGTLKIPRSATFDDAKKLLGDCKDEPPATGGTTSKCRGGAVNVSIGSGSPTEVWLEAAAP